MPASIYRIRSLANVRERGVEMSVFKIGDSYIVVNDGEVEQYTDEELRNALAGGEDDWNWAFTYFRTQANHILSQMPPRRSSTHVVADESLVAKLRKASDG
jgi:hypothetical protein